MTIRFYPEQARDADCVAWWQAVVAAGGTVSGVQLRSINTLIRALKASTVWSQLERLYVAGENFTQFNTDLVSRAVGTNHGATYAAAQGIKGNGSSTYWDSGFNTSTGTKFTQNSAHFGVWQNVAKTTGSDGIHGNVNTDAGTNGVYVDFSVGAGIATSRVNSTSGGGAQTVVNGIGFLMGNRTSSTSAPTWYNGSKSQDNSSASQTPQSLTLWIGGRNFAGSINQASNAQVMAVSIGAGLSDAPAAALYNGLLAYKTAIGA
ncbi:MAG TPA: hypothetical protein VFB13_01965 [Reyranella sp.]|nr:hypothetical protein [Reyranella sp.]